jgi:hypothetical protein
MKATNYFLETLDVEACKELIAKTRKDEITILCPHYSINIQSKYFHDDTIDPESMHWDWEDFEQLLDTTLFVNDYDDLCADPFGVNGLSESEINERKLIEEEEQGIYTYELPEIWASYLINGDGSGLEQVDIDQCDSVTKGYGSCIDVSEESFFGQFKGIGHTLAYYKFREYKAN